MSDQDAVPREPASRQYSEGISPMDCRDPKRGPARGSFHGHPESRPPAMSIQGHWSVAPQSVESAPAPLHTLHGVERRATVADLARPDVLMPSRTLTEEVAMLFDHDPERDAIVIGENGVPAGMITRQSLLTQLSRLYGNALYRRKPIADIADLQPTIVNGAVPPDEAARRATQRPRGTRYDPLIVTVGGAYYGLVQIFTLLDHLNDQAVRRARFSNALSGLPGAVLLETEVRERLAANRPFALILADLDNFKPYNDHYGLARGDTVLLALADLGQRVVEDAGGPDDLFGHVGGDDFVILSTPERAPRICQTLEQRFDGMTTRFYDLVDLANNGIVADDRDGQRRFFPLISLSVVSVEAREVSPVSYVTLTEEVSRRKVATKRAKKRGSVA